MILDGNWIWYGKKIKSASNFVFNYTKQINIIYFLLSSLDWIKMHCKKKNQTQHVCSYVVEDTIYINIKYFYKETFFVF